MAVTCRKHLKFKDLETRAVMVGSQELTIGPLAKAALANLSGENVDMDKIDSTMSELKRWKDECREGGLAELVAALGSFCIKRVATLVEKCANLPPGETESTIAELSKMKDHLADFEDAEAQESRNSAGENLHTLRAAASTNDIVALAASDDADDIAHSNFVS